MTTPSGKQPSPEAVEAAIAARFHGGHLAAVMENQGSGARDGLMEQTRKWLTAAYAVDFPASSGEPRGIPQECSCGGVLHNCARCVCEEAAQVADAEYEHAVLRTTTGESFYHGAATAANAIRQAIRHLHPAHRDTALSSPTCST